METIDIHQILQTVGQYIYMGITTLGGWLALAWTAFTDWLSSLPLPNAIKLFSNDVTNLYLFFGVIAYLLIMNIWAFSLFASDKSQAKRKQQRVREGKLMSVCFWGGATGGLIGMNAFRHKTKKKKFKVAIPILFVIQLVLYSFLLGFLGFWTFF